MCLIFWLRLVKLTAAGLAQVEPKPSVEDGPERHHERESLGEIQRLFNATSIERKGPFCAVMVVCTSYSQVPLGQFLKHPFVSCQMHLP